MPVPVNLTIKNDTTLTASGHPSTERTAIARRGKSGDGSGEFVPLGTFVRYFGGKSGELARTWIVPNLPPHTVYVEPFGGAAGVLFNKPPVEIEVYNDLSSGLATLFRVVRKRKTRRMLEEALELTLYARDEWRYCLDRYREFQQRQSSSSHSGNESLNNNQQQSTAFADLSSVELEVEVARQVYVLLEQSFTGTLGNRGWSFGGAKHGKNLARQFRGKLARFPLVAERLREVIIECNDALDVLEDWNRPDALWYLDPPYEPSTRSQKRKTAKHRRGDYEHEMTAADHEQLLQVCTCPVTQAMIVLSGYRCDLYDRYLDAAGWQRLERKTLARSAVLTNGNGLKERGNQGLGSVAERTECLWS
jgi:DNA adenine methylase